MVSLRLHYFNIDRETNELHVYFIHFANESALRLLHLMHVNKTKRVLYLTIFFFLFIAIQVIHILTDQQLNTHKSRCHTEIELIIHLL